MSKKKRLHQKYLTFDYDRNNDIGLIYQSLRVWYRVVNRNNRTKQLNNLRFVVNTTFVGREETNI